MKNRDKWPGLRPAVKTWLKLGKNPYGFQGSCLRLLHSKKHKRFDVLDDSSRIDPTDTAEIPEKGALAWAR